MTSARPPMQRATTALWLVLCVVACAAVWHWEIASYVLRSATPLVVALLLVLRLARTRDALSPTRRWLAAALLVGASAGVSAATAVAVLGVESGPGSVTDWLGLAYVPFAAAGVLALPRHGGSRLGVVGNGVAAAGSLWFLALSLVEEVSGDQALHGLGALSSMGYVIVPTFVLALLLAAWPGVRGVSLGFMVPLGVGLTLMAVADVAYGVTTLAGEPYDATSWVSATGMAALCCYALAATRGGSEVAARPRHRLAGVAETAVPYAPLAIALAVAFRTFLEGGTVTNQQVLAAVVIGAGITVRHVGAVADHERLAGVLLASAQAAKLETLRDPLTHLPNRKALTAHLRDALTRPEQHPVAVALLDLNDFKDVNDSHGHGTGDLLLQEVARRLSGAVPAGCYVARLGGDEFAICQPAVRDGGAGLAAALVDAFSEPVLVGTRRFLTRPSIGVVLDEGRCPDVDPTTAAESLLAHADVAMYQAKADKAVVGAPVVVLTGQERERAAGLIRLREEINAPDLDQFRVVYQPVVRLRDGGLTGVEALLRWSHPELGEVSPGHFVPLAEQVGSVGVLGEFVLARALDDLVDMQAVAGGRPVRVNVNLSPGQLADDTLPERLAAMLADRGLRPEQLVLEITEGALVRDLEAAAAMVTRIRAQGVSVAVDDFGTGYSSLGYLRRFPVDELKIDREFVSVLPDDERTTVLLRSVVQMAQALGIDTVAEGIETPEQAEVLRQMGCDLAQGYLFSRPVPLAALLRELARDNAGRTARDVRSSRTAAVPLH